MVDNRARQRQLRAQLLRNLDRQVRTFVTLDPAKVDEPLSTCGGEWKLFHVDAVRDSDAGSGPGLLQLASLVRADGRQPRLRMMCEEPRHVGRHRSVHRVQDSRADPRQRRQHVGGRADM